MWFYVDDGFSMSKPVMNVPFRWRPAAIGVWALCGAWSAKEMRDGYVPMEIVVAFGGSPRIIKALVEEAELWTLETDGKTRGVRFRNWSKWQKTRSQVLAARDRDSRRQASWRRENPERTPRGRRENRKNTYANDRNESGSNSLENLDQNGSTSIDSLTSRCDTDVSHSVSHGVSHAAPAPALSNLPLELTVTLGGGSGGNPGNPVPDIPAPEAPAKAVAKRKNGTRLPSDWMPDPAVFGDMANRYPNVDLEFETDKFRDYWWAKTGREATKQEWNATWRNWIRSAWERLANGNQHNGKPRNDDKVSGWLNMEIGPHKQKELPW